MKSIVLNGFTLVSATTLDSQNSTDGVTVNDGTSTIAGQPNNTGPAIYLPGGVQTLSFHNILNVTDLAGNGNGADEPLEIQIGDPNTPLKVSPSIYLDGIFNTVLDSDASTQLNSGPQTTATVNILVNGNIHNLSLGSATQQTIAGGYEYNYPLVDVTGRTAVRATGVDHLKVVGSAKNLTLSRAGIAFQAQNGANTPAATSTSTSIFSSGFSGLKHLGTVDIGGTTDALGLDVSGGKIGRLRLLKGLGDPTGSPTNATQYGYNSAEAGYASRGLLGGLVVAKKINKVVVGAANLTLQTSDNPARSERRHARSEVLRPGRQRSHERGHHVLGFDRQRPYCWRLAKQRDRGGLRLQVVHERTRTGASREQDCVLQATWRPDRLGGFGLIPIQRPDLRKRQRHGWTRQDHRQARRSRIRDRGRNGARQLRDRHLRQGQKRLSTASRRRPCEPSVEF